MTEEQFVTVSRSQVRAFFSLLYPNESPKVIERFVQYFWDKMHPFHTSDNPGEPKCPT